MPTDDDDDGPLYDGQPFDLWRHAARQRLRDLRHDAEALEAKLNDAVGHARDLGVPWEAVGADLGMSRQRATGRFGSRMGPPDLVVRAAVEAHELGHLQLFDVNEHDELVPSPGAITYDDLRAASVDPRFADGDYDGDSDR